MRRRFDPTDDPASFGHHFIVGLQKSPVLTDHDKRLLSRLRPAGIVLFRENFAHDLPYEEWLALHACQLADARQCIERERILVSIDHEGGQVLRTPEPVTRFATAAAWSDQAFAVGRAMGYELRSLGVNVNFAPVADIHLNPDNPVIGERALGTTPTAVEGAACEFLEGLEGAGVMGCAKHFPGHGATQSDSHLELPVLDVPLAVLRERELRPFAALIERGVRLVMTAHIVFPQIDPGVPATLSERLLRGVLREELGYDGVVVSDDVGMQAVAELFSRPLTAARAVGAGCDLIVICAHLADTGQALALAGGLAAAWRDGRLAQETLEHSHGRITSLLEDLPQYAVEELPSAVFARHREAGPVLG
ncbi:MAG: glycoside hydrolase family 3 protein [Acidobacteria bacterium]|nr:glycoside hydrolase family 3 protein [Acidobacteriota bacterium]MCZ6727658.1 glycoside hydrolase family 3 protein [Acidobacteriota bacterium]